MTDQNQLLREFVHAADIQDPLFDAQGWIERARAALAAPAHPQGAGEAVDCTEIAFEAWWKREGQFLRSGGGDYEKTFAYHAWLASLSATTPPASQQAAQAVPEVTDAQILAAARALNKLAAEACQVDEADQWALYGNSFISDAAERFRAAKGEQ